MVSTMDARHTDAESCEDERINWSLIYIVDYLSDLDSVIDHLITQNVMKCRDRDYVRLGDRDGTPGAMTRRFIQKLQSRADINRYEILLKAFRETGNEHVADYMESTTSKRMSRAAADRGSAAAHVQVARERSHVQPVVRQMEELQLSSAHGAKGEDTVDGMTSPKSEICGQDVDRYAVCLQPSESKLHQYSHAGNLTNLEYLITKCNVDVNACDHKGRTPLFYAVERGHTKVVVALTVTHNANVNARDPTRMWTPLHFACNRGFHKIAGVLLNRGADVNAEDIKGETPLFVACSNKSKPTVDILLRRGARVDLARKDETTPLIVAARTGDEKIVGALLSPDRLVSPTSACSPGAPGSNPAPVISRRPRVSHRNLRGETALHWASMYGHLEVVELLMQHLASVHCQTNAGLTPLYCASQEGHVSVVDLLLKHGAASGVDVATGEGATPLYIASEKGHTAVVSSLIRHNANINFQKARTQHTPLITAANSGHRPVIVTLLQHNADVNIQNEAGWTPLHAACYNGHTDVAFVLIERNANVNAKDKEWATPLHLACYHGHSERTLTERLLKHNAEVHVVDTSGRTPLHDSCLHPHKDISELLIEHDAALDTADTHGNSPLHYASAGGHADLTKLLVERGAVSSGKTKGGDTPLHLACQNGHDEVAKILLDSGADVNSVNAEGDTPLHCAIRNNHDKIFDCLFRRANMDILNTRGETPHSLAKEKRWIK